MKHSHRIAALLITAVAVILLVRFFFISTKPLMKTPCSNRPRYYQNMSRIKTPRRYIIDTCVDQDQCYGWGDRQRAIVTTYLISLLSNRQFGIYMTNPCQLETVLVPNKVPWIINKDELDVLCTRDIYMLNDHVKNFSNHQMVESADFEQIFPEDVIYVHTAQDYVTAIRRNKLTAEKIPWLHSHTLSRVYRFTLRHLFSLSDEARTTITIFFSKYVKNYTLVCAHIRMGDPWSNLVRTPKSEIRVIWDFLYKYNDSMKYKIYVATDANETKEEARKLFRDQIVETAGTIEHTERSGSCDAFRTVIIEQEILTRCNILILTKSSLGVIAAFLRGSNKELFCFFKERVFPCNMDILHELHESVL